MSSTDLLVLHCLRFAGLKTTAELIRKADDIDMSLTSEPVVAAAARSLILLPHSQSQLNGSLRRLRRHGFLLYLPSSGKAKAGKWFLRALKYPDAKSALAGAKWPT
ncbi:MAG: hypothetical protein WKF96_01600 [Solirubrobacteraceae bacterium]